MERVIGELLKTNSDLKESHNLIMILKNIFKEGKSIINKMKKRLLKALKLMSYTKLKRKRDKKKRKKRRNISH